jgi:putative aldouronate transport system permease protein
MERVNHLKKVLNRNKYLLLMSIPGLVLVITFCYVPMYGIVIAFQRFSSAKGYFRSPWVGLYYFKMFLMDPYAWRVFRNTLLLGVYSILLGFPPPIILALIFNEVKSNWYKKTVQTLSYIPHFVSTVIIVGLIKEMFSSDGGIINIMIQNLGGSPIVFMSRPEWFRTLYIGSGIWKDVGFGTIIYLASISGINPEIYEAATIDGASRWGKMIYVTIPSIMPTIVILLILRVGGILGNDYMKILLMYSPATYETADVISTYVYRAGLENASFSYAAAVGLMQNIISMIFLITTNYISKKVNETSLW